MGKICGYIFVLTGLLLLFRLPAATQEDCPLPSFLAKGRVWHYQWYDANGRPTYQGIHTVAQTTQTEVQIELKIIDAYQDTVYKGQYSHTCINNRWYQHLAAKFTPEMLVPFAGLKLRSEESGWLLPIDKMPGDSIPQAFAHIEGYSQNSKIIDLDLAIGGIQLIAQETLQTPAGGYACMAMAYELWITQTIRKKFRLRDWFSQEVGIIRREVFDRSGKYFGYCELTAFQ
ncbi:MAG: hypothetical protein R2795_18710 [Saprospiraceae bacterium]